MIDAIDIRNDEELVSESRAGREIASLMEHPGWEVLMAEVNSHKQDLTDVLVGMNPASEAAKYADLCGQIRGVGSLEGLALEVVEVGQSADRTIEYREAQA